ncbi:hypothetical protein RHO15_05700 [Utexia brackfieldae]|uniref:hypothetical protein n=1 Tax=Utexia brackfieldae TaxID=3074108 RepID=UPI00370D4688
MQSTFNLNDFLAQYSLSMGQFMTSIAIVGILFVLVFAVVSLIAAKMCRIQSVRFRSALLVSVIYFAISILSGFLFRSLIINLNYASELINFVIGYALLSYLYALFFKISFLRGLLITFVVGIIFMLLLYLVNIALM